MPFLWAFTKWDINSLFPFINKKADESGQRFLKCGFEIKTMSRGEVGKWRRG
jgi:hypothetical protein